MGGTHLRQGGQTGSPSKGVPLGLCQEPSKDPETRLKGSKVGIYPAISPIASWSPTVLSCYTWQHMVALVDVPPWVLSLQNVHWSPGPATVRPLQPSLHQGQPGLQLGSLEGTGKERCVRLGAWKVLSGHIPLASAWPASRVSPSPNATLGLKVKDTADL